MWYKLQTSSPILRLARNLKAHAIWDALAIQKFDESATLDNWKMNVGHAGGKSSASDMYS